MLSRKPRKKIVDFEIIIESAFLLAKIVKKKYWFSKSQYLLRE